MALSWCRECLHLRLVSTLGLFGVSGCLGDVVLAQIIPDTTLGTQNSQVTPISPRVDLIRGGAARGVNLFHSFQEFNIGNGRSAYFSNPSGIENILGRVTGTNPSNIFGKLGVLGNANLFLINPNGIIFGAGAQLDIRGSFSAGTASSFKFPDGSEFSATNPTAPPLLTVNVSPGLQWGASKAGATITNRANLAAGQDLTLFADKLNLRGQLNAGRDLTLLAQDSVRVRDSLATPFLAQSGGNLTVQGNRGIDIKALNHPLQTPFVSGGNLSLISDGIISGDARFASGGSFSIRSVSGGLANFVSKHDPIISALGDVDVAANYTGASLLVESKGNIRFQGNINITGPDTSGLPPGPDTATLSTVSALILRSGQSSLAYGGVNSGSVPGAGTAGVPAGITIGGNVILQPFNGAGGIVSLSAASGNVSTRLISTNGQQQNPYYKVLDPFLGFYIVVFRPPTNDANGGAISLSAFNGSITTGDLYSWSYSKSGSAAQGGTITLSANNSISNANLYSFSKSESGSGGQGGAISLEAANGSIITGDLDSSSFSGSAAQGGAISLSAFNGSITTGDLDSSSFSGSGGQGGAISLIAANGSITTGSLDSSSSSESGSGGQGGAISLEAANGSITTGDFVSSSVSIDGNRGQGGNISLIATNGSIITGSMFSSSVSIDGSGSQQGGGAISLEATNGSITTGDLVSYSFSGSGGAISLFATNDINIIGSLLSFSVSESGSAGQGGNISLIAANGSLHTGSMLSSSYSRSGSAAQGGNINLFAAKTIQLLRYEYDNSDTYKPFPGGLINSTGMLGSGHITIVSHAPLALDNSVISSDTFGFGKAGEIHISAPSISLIGGTQLSASTHSSGPGGNITLIASDSVELIGATTQVPKGIFDIQQMGVARILSGTFLGGFIPTGNVPPLDENRVPQFPPGTLFPSGVFTQATANSTGSPGSIRIETGRLIIKDGASIATTLWGKSSNASNTNISVEALDSILITNGGSILSGVAGGARGNSGNIKLMTPSLSLTAGGFVQTQTLGQGNAGNIQVFADAVNLSGAGSDLRSGSGGSNPLLGNLGSLIGEGGNISISAGSFLVADGAALDAQTFTNSKGGNITLDANTLRAVNGGRLLTSTSSGGKAGDITVSAKEIQLSGSNSGLFAQTSSAADAGNLTLQPLGNGQTLRVNFFDGAQISASTSGSGKGGNLMITAPSSITLTGNGSLISAETSGSGTGGDLTLKTGTLTVQDGAQVTVSGTKTGNAGNLAVFANEVLLDNGGKLIAETASGQGGNIQLQAEDLLLMRNRSLISTSAGTASAGGDGGNVKIKAPLVVAIPSEDSDIRANAYTGTGGKIDITASGIFGFQVQRENTPKSDISASSQFGVQGTVILNTPDVDPNQGLTNLPTEVVDASNQIDQSCAPGGALASEKNRFIITRRGGLPDSPNQALSPDSVWEDWRMAEDSVPPGTQQKVPVQSQPTTSVRQQTKDNQQRAIVEAQGWEFDTKGNVVLTADPTTVTPHDSSLNPPNCHS